MAYSTLSALVDDATLTNGATITHTENNTHRTSRQNLSNNLLTEATAQEKNRAGASEPTDKAEGIIYCDTTNDPAQLKFYKDGSANLFILASLEALNVFTVNQTFSAKIICDDATDATSGTTGSIQTDGGLGVVKKAHFGDRVTIENTAPQLRIIDTNASLDEGDWEFALLGDASFNLRTLTEAGALIGTPFSVARAGGITSVGNMTVKTTAFAALNIESYSATNNTRGQVLIRKSSNGTLGTIAETVTGEALGSYTFQGANSSSAFAGGAQIVGTQRGSAGASNVPADIDFLTATASAGAVRRVTITTEGNLSIGSAVGAPTSLVGGIAMTNGTAATAALSNGISAWAANDAASLSELVVMSEGLTKYHLGGSADEDIGVGGTIDSQITAVGNVGAGEDDLMSFTIPADIFDVNGKAVRIRANFNGNALDNITLKFHFGASSITLFSGAVFAAAFGSVAVDIIIARTASDVQDVSAIGFDTATSTIAVGVVGAETDSGTIVVKFTGENTSDTSSSAVIQQLMITEVLN